MGGVEGQNPPTVLDATIVGQDRDLHTAGKSHQACGQLDLAAKKGHSCPIPQAQRCRRHIQKCDGSTSGLQMGLQTSSCVGADRDQSISQMRRKITRTRRLDRAFVR